MYDLGTYSTHMPTKKANPPTNPRIYPIIFVMILLCMTGLVAIIPSDCYASYIIDTNQDMLVLDKVNGVYEATATILALVSFGSVLGMRLSANKNTAGRQRGGLLLVSGSSINVILIQVLVMGGLCCGSLFTSQYFIYITLTGIALIGMVLGYATIVTAQSKTAYRRPPRTNRIKGNIKTTTKTKAKAHHKTDSKGSGEREPPAETS